MPSLPVIDLGELLGMPRMPRGYPGSIREWISEQQNDPGGALRAPSAIPRQPVENRNAEEDDDDDDTSAKGKLEEDKDYDVDKRKLPSKKPPARKTAIQPKKRLAWARKLPTMLKQSATSKRMRGITMKRPGKWVRFFSHLSLEFRHYIILTLSYCYYFHSYYCSKPSSIMQDSLGISESLPVKKRLCRPMRLSAKCSSPTPNLLQRAPGKPFRFLVRLPIRVPRIQNIGGMLRFVVYSRPCEPLILSLCPF
jgi:hypothetical protein